MNILATIGFLIYLWVMPWISQPADVWYYDDNGTISHLHVDYLSDPSRCQCSIDTAGLPDLSFDIQSGSRMPEGIRIPDIQCYSQTSPEWERPLVIVSSVRKTIVHRVYFPEVIR